MHRTDRLGVRRRTPGARAEYVVFFRVGELHSFALGDATD